MEPSLPVGLLQGRSYDEWRVPDLRVLAKEKKISGGRKRKRDLWDALCEVDAQRADEPSFDGTSGRSETSNGEEVERGEESRKKMRCTAEEEHVDGQLEDRESTGSSDGKGASDKERKEEETEKRFLGLPAEEVMSKSSNDDRMEVMDGMDGRLRDDDIQIPTSDSSCHQKPVQQAELEEILEDSADTYEQSVLVDPLRIKKESEDEDVVDRGEDGYDSPTMSLYFPVSKLSFHPVPTLPPGLMPPNKYAHQLREFKKISIANTVHKVDQGHYELDDVRWEFMDSAVSLQVYFLDNPMSIEFSAHDGRTLYKHLDEMECSLKTISEKELRAMREARDRIRHLAWGRVVGQSNKWTEEFGSEYARRIRWIGAWRRAVAVKIQWETAACEAEQHVLQATAAVKKDVTDVSALLALRVQSEERSMTLAAVARAAGGALKQLLPRAAHQTVDETFGRMMEETRLLLHLINSLLPPDAFVMQTTAKVVSLGDVLSASCSQLEAATTCALLQAAEGQARMSTAVDDATSDLLQASKRLAVSSITSIATRRKATAALDSALKVVRRSRELLHDRWIQLREAANSHLESDATSEEVRGLVAAAEAAMAAEGSRVATEAELAAEIDLMSNEYDSGDETAEWDSSSSSDEEEEQDEGRRKMMKRRRIVGGTEMGARARRLGAKDGKEEDQKEIVEEKEVEEEGGRGEEEDRHEIITIEDDNENIDDDIEVIDDDIEVIDDDIEVIDDDIEVIDDDIEVIDDDIEVIDDDIEVIDDNIEVIDDDIEVIDDDIETIEEPPYGELPEEEEQENHQWWKALDGVTLGYGQEYQVVPDSPARDAMPLNGRSAQVDWETPLANQGARSTPRVREIMHCPFPPCPFTARYEIKYDRHIVQHGGDGPYRCRMCSHNAPHQQAADHHLELHRQADRMRR